jgi:twitching motility protein PilT
MGLIEIGALLRAAQGRAASDLHLVARTPPMLRIDGSLIAMEAPPLDADELARACLDLLSEEQRGRFTATWELDFSFVADGLRFRANLHRERGCVEAAFRVLNDTTPEIRALGLPAILEELARRNQGMILVTGPTGAGKSTTLAALVNQINRERRCMIITIEDPIEYVFTNASSIVKQRELGLDTMSFPTALRQALRQDPDVIVVGEMRDLDTISTALTAAETGHLVLATIHTPDVSQTVDRIIDVFPPHQQSQVRLQFANTIEGIVAQQLIPRADGAGRVVACEVLVATIGARKILRSGKNEQLLTAMETAQDRGMITMDKALRGLVARGLIRLEEALARCRYPESFHA